MTTSAHPHIVILGSGFGALRTAKALRKSKARVTMLSPRNHFLFTPLLIGTTVGTSAFTTVSEPIRHSCPGVTFLQAACTGINPETHTLTAQSPLDARTFSLTYDWLVIAVGGTQRTFGIPGVEEHACFLKELSHARQIRQQLLSGLEQASLPGTTEAERDRLLHTVVVGGGPTGIEFAAEVHDFLEDAASVYPDLIPHAKITLLEAAAEILPSFEQSLQQEAERRFHREHIDVRKETPAAEVQADRVVLKSGEELPCGLVVWATGIRPHDWIKESGLTLSERGTLLTDDTCQVQGQSDIYAIGDTATMEDRPYPPTAQLAQQQGRYLGRQLRRKLKEKSVQPFRFRNMGQMAYLGDRSAIADLSAGSLRGRKAWWLWRSVYLTKLVGWRNKIRLLANWLATRLGGRDTSHIP